MNAAGLAALSIAIRNSSSSSGGSPEDDWQAKWVPRIFMAIAAALLILPLIVIIISL